MSDLPTNPTAAQCIALILETYRPEALNVVLGSRFGALDGRRPIELLDTPAGRSKVYAWALGLAEGVMG